MTKNRKILIGTVLLAVGGLAAVVFAQTQGSPTQKSEKTLYPSVGILTSDPLKDSPATTSAPGVPESAAVGTSEGENIEIPDLQMEGPTHFHEQEWIILNAVKDRTHGMFDPATNLLLRKTALMEEKYFPKALPLTRLDLFAAPVEYRARFIKLNVQFLHSKKMENRPSNCTYDGPLFQIVCQDLVTGDNVLVLSPQDTPPEIRFKGKCTIVGFFDKLLRFKTDKVSQDNGNPESTYILIVGWIRPFEPRLGPAAEADGGAAPGGAAPGGEGAAFGSTGTVLIMVIALVGLYFFIRIRSGATAGAFIGRSQPLKLPTRNTSVPNDPAYTEPIDLTGYGKEKKPDEPDVKN